MSLCRDGAVVLDDMLQVLFSLHVLCCTLAVLAGVVLPLLLRAQLELVVDQLLSLLV